jgi:HlyD family secretion protein
VALLAVWAVRARRQPIDVESAAVSEGPLRVTVNETGTTRVRAHADVNATVAGRWVPLALRAGDAVRAGQRLGALYPAPLDASAQEQARARLGATEASVREAETRVSATRSAFDDAARTLQRLERVAKVDGVSEQDLERARTAVEASRSDYDAARLRVKAAEFDLDGARAVVAPFKGGVNALAIVAPVGGSVLHVYEEHERVVAPGTPLAEVGDAGDLEVVLPLLTADAARVKVGASVSMTLGAAGDTLNGRVVRIEPSAFTKISALGVEEQRVNVLATVPANVAHVGDRYHVDARVTVWETVRALRVPAAALMHDGDRWFAYVLEDGRARRRTVQAGERGEDLVEVRSGLKAGERVVLYPGDRLTDGAAVRTR